LSPCDYFEAEIERVAEQLGAKDEIEALARSAVSQSKTHREYYLNEQMKAIQKELGDGEERDDISEFEEKIEHTKLSKEARDKALAEPCTPCATPSCPRFKNFWEE
jgi:ATP-dependent Lon protease